MICIKNRLNNLSIGIHLTFGQGVDRRLEYTSVRIYNISIVSPEFICIFYNCGLTSNYTYKIVLFRFYYLFTRHPVFDKNSFFNY